MWVRRALRHLPLAPRRRVAGPDASHRVLAGRRAGSHPQRLADRAVPAGRPAPAPSPQRNDAIPGAKRLLDLPAAPAAAVRAAVLADGPGVVLAADVWAGHCQVGRWTIWVRLCMEV